MTYKYASPFLSLSLLLCSASLFAMQDTGRKADTGPEHEDEVENQYRNMTRLNLCRDNVDDVTLIRSLDPYRNFTALTQIDLSHNRISAAGAAVLANLIARQSRLTSLDVSHNHINDQGVQELCTALKDKPLVKLALGNNPITSESTSAISKLMNSKQLLCLDISGTIQDWVIQLGQKKTDIPAKEAKHNTSDTNYGNGYCPCPPPM